MSIGVTITPGTFNPPAALVETMGVVTWPAAKSGWLKKKGMQWNSSPSPAVDLEPSTIQLAEFNFVTGGRRFKDFTAPGAAALITASGVRYVGNGTYTVASVLSGVFTCVPTGGVFTPSGTVEFGEFTIGDGGTIRVQIPYVMTLSGTSTDPDGTYSLEIETNAGGVIPALASGVIYLDFNITALGASVVEATTLPVFTLRLLRNGSLLETIRVAVPVHYRANISGTGGIFVGSVGGTFSDTFFGRGSGPVPSGTPPTIPFNSYVRSSYGTEGSLEFA